MCLETIRYKLLIFYFVKYFSCISCILEKYKLKQKYPLFYNLTTKMFLIKMTCLHLLNCISWDNLFVHLHKFYFEDVVKQYSFKGFILSWYCKRVMFSLEGAI